MEIKNDKQLTVSAVSSLQLVMSDWKNYFTDEEVKLTLALALNYCVNFHQLKIKGYLITANKLFLILYCWEVELDGILHELREQLRRQLKQELRLKRKHYEDDLDDEDIRDLVQRLFKICAFNGNELKQLITGHDPVLPYYSGQLARLKWYVKHHEYCSFIDYEGGKGPVKVYMSN